MLLSALRNVTAPYSRFESWGYDRFVAEAVMELGRDVFRSILREVPAGARLLDVGSGGGQLAVAIANDRPDVVITGVDLSREQVLRARRRARAVEERVSFVIGSAEALPFPDNCFHGVLSVASIKHWPDRAKGLAECVRVLRPGGTLVVFEGDREHSLEDAKDFLAKWRLPALLRPPALVLLRSRVLAPALDLAEARALAAPLGLDALDVRRVPKTPGLVIEGKKPRPAGSSLGRVSGTSG